MQLNCNTSNLLHILEEAREIFFQILKTWDEWMNKRTEMQLSFLVHKQMEMKESLSFCQLCLWTLFHEASKKAFLCQRSAGWSSSLCYAGRWELSFRWWVPKTSSQEVGAGSQPWFVDNRGDRAPSTVTQYPWTGTRREHWWKPKQHCPLRRSGFMGLGRTFWKYHLKQLLSLLSTCLPTACPPSITLRWWQSRLLKSLIHIYDSRLTVSQQSQEKWHCERLKIYRRCVDILIANFIFL